MFEVQKQEVHKDRPNANRQEARRCIQRMRCDRSFYHILPSHCSPLCCAGLFVPQDQGTGGMVGTFSRVDTPRALDPPKAQVAWDQKQMEQDVQDWKLWKLCLSINATLVGRQSEGSLSEAVPAN